MKVVVGHKVLNLEELFNISQGAEVEVDSVVYNEFNCTSLEMKNATSWEGPAVELSGQEKKAVLAAKLVQIAKLKSNA